MALLMQILQTTSPILKHKEISINTSSTNFDKQLLTAIVHQFALLLP